MANMLVPNFTRRAAIPKLFCVSNDEVMYDAALRRRQVETLVYSGAHFPQCPGALASATGRAGV